VPIAHTTLLSKAGRLPSGKPAAPASDRYAGGGGILLLTDRRPNEDVELVDFEGEERAIPVEQADQDQTGSTNAGEPGRTAGTFIDENAPEADPPEPFEVSVGGNCCAHRP
jgi:26S proteasome regulatory subunit N2